MGQVHLYLNFIHVNLLVKISNDCGTLTLVKPGIMVDRFQHKVDDLPAVVNFSVPPCLNRNGQLKLKNELKTERVASAPVHVFLKDLPT